VSVEDNKRVAIESFRLIETGDIVMADRIVAVDFINREADDDKQSERLERGPAGFLATSRWLRGIFSDLRFHEIEAIGEGDLVAVKATMAGRHTGEFQGVAPSSKLIRQRQIHIFRLRDGKLVEHLAQRDDLDLLLQIGWRGPKRR
jgi:predicted ester cyclase